MNLRPHGPQPCALPTAPHPDTKTSPDFTQRTWRLIYSLLTCKGGKLHRMTTVTQNISDPISINVRKSITPRPLTDIRRTTFIIPRPYKNRPDLRRCNFVYDVRQADMRTVADGSDDQWSTLPSEANPRPSRSGRCDLSPTPA